MPGIEETRPHDGGRASSAASAGFPSDGQPDGSTEGQHCANELVSVIEEQDGARDRVIQRQRRDASDAVRRTLPNSLTDPEIVLQRETATLYTRILELEESGKIRWDDWSQDWTVARPRYSYTNGTDSTRPPSYSTDEILDKFDKVRRNGKRWSARCPAHTDKHPSLAITEGDKGWLLRCWAGCTFTEIMDAGGLEPQRMFF